MRQRLVTAGLVLALVSACSGTPSVPSTPAASDAHGDPIAPVAQSQTQTRRTIAAVTTDASATIANPGFETGSLSPWTSCGDVAPSVTSAKAHTGTYSLLAGKTSKPEPNGLDGVCQTVTVPAGASLSFWVYEGTNDTVKYADQEADVYDTSGNLLTNLYTEAKSTGGWIQKTFSLASYAGQTVQLFFGVSGNGYASDYVYEYLDDVSLTGSGSTPAPTTAPTAGPTSKPTASPTTGPTAKPTTAPTAAPTSAAYTCNNQGFLNDQSAFAAGSISADQFVDICGSVTQVLAAKKTTSGNHGYFYVAMPSGYQIEIVSNLDAMAEASTDKPPSTWPWVAVNDYVYVQGRYYYDSSSSQGVDWTEDDTSSSWEHVGYVAVCTSSGASCQKYW